MRKVERGKGSTTGYGALEFYIRSSFDHPTEIDGKLIVVGHTNLQCSGIEKSETTHKLGDNRNFVATTAFRQWTNNQTPFGTIHYHFERLGMDGTSFNQRLILRSTGKDAKTSISGVDLRERTRQNNALESPAARVLKQ